jgi:hypothetical protein
MRKTPDPISKKRQKIKLEMDTWRESIKVAENRLQLDPKTAAEVAQQVAFGKARLLECRQQMAELRSKGTRKFWQRSET